MQFLAVTGQSITEIVLKMKVLKWNKEYKVRKKGPGVQGDDYTCCWPERHLNLFLLIGLL